MDPLIAYVPQDRRRAIASGGAMPEHTSGAALFADISGFTPLTEVLTRALGPRRGAEELTLHLNRVYEALINAVEQYGGSVLSFAGDAMICWFDQADTEAPGRAVACAMAMQQALAQIQALLLPDGTSIALALKATIASGPARRFVVGDPTAQLIDTLVGATIARTATAEHLAERGEIVIDRPTVDALPGVQVAAWRTDTISGGRFAVLADWPVHTAPPASEMGAGGALLAAEQLRPWLLPAVYARIQAGHGDLLTEFRPAVALFLRLSGWDEERPDAGQQLDAFIQSAQAILMRFEGTLLQLNIGDKGSYIYAAFGAPLAHEDDPQRAVRAALALRRMAQECDPPMPVQIGISRGTMRAGAYGSSTRRTYGIIGDDVNLAARLMQAAAPGEILVSGRLQQALAGGVSASSPEQFTLDPRLPVYVKGKAEPQPVFAVNGAQQLRAIRLQEPTYALPMVGRGAELQLIAERMALATHGHGQIVGICADAGMGKSRLIAEVIRLGWQHGLGGYGGAGQADSLNTSYLSWRAIFNALFDLDPAAPLPQQIQILEAAIERLAPARVESLPLLEAVLGLPLPENRFTRVLAPQFRRSALEALLTDCLQAAARDGAGLLLVLEDLHWIDPASCDLLEQLARGCAHLPILIILAYRPLEVARHAPSLLQIEGLPNFTRINLTSLSAAETAQAIQAKLSQLFPERAAAAPPALIEQVALRAQGNPFYLEELLNYMRDRGIDLWDLHDAAALALELPASLQSLILSRIDQLSARQQLTLKVASVIGRAFRFEHLRGYYPNLGQPADLKRDLEALDRLDLTPLETPEPDLSYLFKHIVTREVAYESLAYANRAALHAQYARYLEAQVGDDDERYVSLLAYHYDQTEHLPQRRTYLFRAGEVAARRYANTEALDYLRRALAITADAEGRFEILMARVKIAHHQGDRASQARDLDALSSLAAALDAPGLRAAVALQRAIYAEATSDYPGCISAAEQAAALGSAAGLLDVVCEARLCWAVAHQRQGNLEAAYQHVEQSLQLACQIGDRSKESRARYAAGVIASHQNQFREAQTAFEQSLSIAQSLADRWLESRALNSLGILAYEQGDFAVARTCYERSLQLAHEIGDRYGEVTKLTNLGSLAGGEGDYSTARGYCEQALRLSREIGDRQGECMLLGNLGGIAMMLDDNARALAYYQQAARLSEDIGARELEAWGLWGIGNVELRAGRSAAADQAYRQALAIQRELGMPVFLMEILAGLARAALADENLPRAQRVIEEILRYLADGGLEGAEEPSWVYLTCYEVLRASQDVRAGALLESGYRQIQERAARIHVAESQRRFLEQRPYNRALVAAWRAAQMA